LNRSTFALFVALLIHIILLLLFWLLESDIKKDVHQEKPKEKKIKISLRDIPKKDKKAGIKKEPKKLPKIAPPMPKGSQLKKIVKKPLIKSKVIHKKVSKPKIQTKPIYHMAKQIIKKIVEQNTTKINPLYAMLLEDKSNDKPKQRVINKSPNNSIESNIKKLYGEKFGKLSQAQQEYILDNQEIMRRITQQVLNRQASVADLSRIDINTNDVVEFYLHPNGDMSDFKFLKKTGYFTLDDVTRATIEYAYSKYPRPKEKTLIRYNVFYNLARY